VCVCECTGSTKLQENGYGMCKIFSLLHVWHNYQATQRDWLQQLWPMNIMLMIPQGAARTIHFMTSYMSDSFGSVCVCVKWSKRNIAVRNQSHCHSNSRAIWDHAVLPTTRQTWHSRLYHSQLKLVLDLAILQGCKGELTYLASYIQRFYTRPKKVTHSGTNQALHRVASFLRRTTLPLCQTGQRLLVVPRTKTKHGDHSFAVQGPRVWNSLPSELRALGISLTVFRDKLKTYLFDM